MSNPTLETFAAWEHDQRAYLAATNLDTWQQQRRELFMPEGAQALRIPLADVAGVEVMPGSIAHDGQGNRLLDFHMALSERFCHEVMAAEPRDGVAGENELTKEQWGVLDDEEKMMIKEWLKGRLARSVPVPP